MPQYQTNAILQKIIAQKLIHLASKQTSFIGKNIIDIGCGTGFIAQNLVSNGVLKSNVLQVDYNNNSLQIAKRFGKTLHANFNQPLPINEKFDIILSSMALQWAENLEKVLAYLKTILSDGGSLFCAIPLHGSLKELYEVIGHDFMSFSQTLSMHLMEQKIYSENALIGLKNIHLLDLKNGNTTITKKQLLLLSNTTTLWKIGFFYFQNAR